MDIEYKFTYPSDEEAAQTAAAVNAMNNSIKNDMDSDAMNSSTDNDMLVLLVCHE